MRWYQARDHDGALAADLRPAVVVVHSLHPDLVIAQSIARALSRSGWHALIVEMPGYASRPGDQKRMTGITTLMYADQAVADTRRTRDAVAALPGIDPKRIHLQGTSLGGMIAAVAGSLDNGFVSTQLLVTGGDAMQVLKRGQKDAWHLARALSHVGYTEDRLRQLINPVEPTALAHRLDPQTTWLYYGRTDLVIPRFSSDALADAAGLDAAHRVEVDGNHYTMFMTMPAVVQTMIEHMQEAEQIKTIATPPRKLADE